jgi:hypothetical protein
MQITFAHIIALMAKIYSAHIKSMYKEGKQ